MELLKQLIMFLAPFSMLLPPHTVLIRKILLVKCLRSADSQDFEAKTDYVGMYLITESRYEIKGNFGLCFKWTLIIVTMITLSNVDNNTLS